MKFYIERKISAQCHFILNTAYMGLRSPNKACHLLVHLSQVHCTYKQGIDRYHGNVERNELQIGLNTNDDISFISSRFFLRDR
jgi:hypothetical protein